jgi:protein-S-isoprenylcysteine O-methyltransferase Ste14
MERKTQGSATSPSVAASAGRLRDLLFRWRGWLVIALGAGLLALFWPPRPTVKHALAALPLVLLGVSMRVWSRCYFTRGSDTRRIQAHRLVVCGPYRRVRNPLYLGNMAVGAGVLFAFFGPEAALALFAGMFLLYSGVIRSEEVVLERTYGESYAEFRRRVPRWLPLLRALPADAGAPPPALAHALRKESQRIGGILGAWALALLLAMVLD